MNSIMIIGGGITGLSAAYELHKKSQLGQLTPTIQVIEQAPHFGGKIHTLQREGCTIEKGPDSFLARKKPMIELISELGLVDRLVATNPYARKTYLVRDRRLHTFPRGLLLGIPTQLRSLLAAPFLSTTCKARALLDLILPYQHGIEDVSIGDLLRKRFGAELVDVLIEPIIAGIYASDIDQLSVQATFPYMQHILQRKHSLIRGIVRYHAEQGDNQHHLPERLRGSVFLSFEGGLQTFVEALIHHLSGVKLCANRQVSRIQRMDRQYRVTYQDGLHDTVDAIIATIPPHQLAHVVDHPVLSQALRGISSASVAHVVLIYDAKQLPQRLDGSGFVVPRSEQMTMTACTWTSSKWLHTAPPDKVMLRGYVGRLGEEQWMAWSDDELVARVQEEIAQIMGIRVAPVSIEITRMPQSMPQYRVGHLEQVKQIESILHTDFPSFYVAGAGYYGVGLPDCIQQGRQIAQQAMANE